MIGKNNNKSMIKKFNEFLNEGCETTSSPGSGTAVGFGDASGRFTPAAGQAVGGGDSPSSFSSNSNSCSVESLSSQSAFVPKSIASAAKIRKRNKNNKNKKDRVYNQIGAEIDKLYLRKSKNEGMITNWEDFIKLNEDDGGGSGGATLGSVGGMGAIVSAQPSSIPGSVWGADATKGSGDIGQPLRTYTKQPAGRFPKQGKKRRRKDKDSLPSNPVIDNFYVTNYKESTNGNVIQNWQAFTDTNN